MKTNILKSLMLIAALLTSTHASAYDFEVDGIYYDITSYANKTAEVTYQGSSAHEYNEYVGSVVIPETVTYNNSTYTVTSIGSYTFEGCDIRSLTIPQSITSIGDCAFAFRGYNIPTIISKAITPPTLGRDVFSEWTLIKVPLASYFAYLAIEGWNNNQNIYIGEKYNDLYYMPSSTEGEVFVVSKPGAGIFDYSEDVCYSGDIVIPSEITVDNTTYKVTSTGSAFYKSRNLKSITIPESVNTIGNKSFYGCSNITYIAIPSNVNTIGKEAFSNGTNISTIVSLNTVPPTCDKSTFTGIDMTTCTLYVPKDAYATYWSADVWKEFKNIKVLTKAESLSLDSTETVLLNDTTQLTATIAPVDVSLNKLSWISSDTKVAKVDGNGTVVGLAPGKATITARTIDGSKLTATCEVEVVDIKIDSITFHKDLVKLKKRESINLSCSISPENANYSNVTWSSSDVNIATVIANDDGTATVTGISEGKTTITASSGDVSATCEVEVYTIKVDSIKLNLDSIALEMYGTADLTYTIYPQDAEVKTVTWVSSNSTIAMVRVNNDGTATILGAGPGTATVTATADDGSEMQASCDVLVVDDITDAEDVVKDEGSQAEYYDLLGVKVENPSKGAFIKKQGTKTIKVVL